MARRSLFQASSVKNPSKNFQMDKKFSYRQIFLCRTEQPSSNLFSIKTGVPQGSILSPTLFSIFINDILLKLENYDLKGLLYADDLFSFFSNVNVRRINIVLQYYLNSLELWLRSWRLKVTPHKCSYNIYKRNGKCNKRV